MVPKFETHKPSEYIFNVLLCLAQLIEEKVLHALSLPNNTGMLWPIYLN